MPTTTAISDPSSPTELALPDENAVAGEDCVFPDSFRAPRTRSGATTAPTSTPTRVARISAVAGDSPSSGARRSTALVAADFDRDGDVDLAEVVDGEPGRFFLNDRHWRFREDLALAPRRRRAEPRRGGLRRRRRRALDPRRPPRRGRGRRGLAQRLARRGRGRGGHATPLELPAPAAGALAATSLLPIDLDNDGDLDLVRAVYAGGNRTETTLEILRRDGKSWTVTATGLAAPRDLRGLAAVDVDGDGRRDVLASDATGALHVLSNLTEGAGNWLVLELRGKRVNDTAPMWSNHFGLGAAVELGHGPRRVHRDLASSGSFLAGADPNLHFGLGEAGRADYTRIIWPDLVMQNELDLEANRRHLYHEVNRKASSCPVLFKSCGDGTFAFVTDFLGTGGLGFYVGPDRYAPPDADETVAIGEFEPDPDGRYRLRISEPMEEVCYVDELALIVVEHDAGTEVLADERLAISGPAPSGRPLLFRRTFAPRAALSGDGRDTLDELLRIDRRYQKGLRRDPRFLGYLAAPSLVDLSFDAEAIRAARPSPEARLVLLVDGSVEYPYSHVNYAGTQVDLKAESLGVEVERDGAWRAVATDVGYPAGMQRAMTIPLEGLDGGELARVRLRTELEIYLDRVRVGWAEELPATAIVRHEFDAAELRFLGYPLEYSPDGALPTIYDYQRVSPASDWKSLGGRFTRFGDVRELLRSPDDRYVIMNHGDEIALEFAAARLSPLPEGRRRSFFLRAHGWCKDMDPYTATPDTVEPLPWSTMGDYPPREAFPWTEEARRWDREWNTRVVAPTFEPTDR
ncbi:MAG: FG-GAP-like repeat-containing protein [Planctomycetota bacterium]